jgi:hypothetical protein
MTRMDSFIGEQYNSASRCQNKFGHTEALYVQRPPRQADFLAENVHGSRLFDTGQTVKKKTTPVKKKTE